MQTAELKKVITKYMKEIQEKDKHIGVREKKIYSLKKKTQELEKFKFVLDYKIKDLKRDITPRQNEILKLKAETNAMDIQLMRYNRLNANLGYLVDDLRTKQEYMQESIKTSRATIRTNETDIQRKKNDVYLVLQSQMDPEGLRRQANKELFKYISNKEPNDVEVDTDIKKEFEQQKNYMQNSVATLQKRFETSKAAHKEDNNNIMIENMALIDQITKLRTEVKGLNELFLSHKGKRIMEQRKEEEKELKAQEIRAAEEDKIRAHRALFASDDEESDPELDMPV